MATPTQAEIIAALQFELSLLDEPLNTSDQPAFEMTYRFEGSSQPSDFPSNTNYSGWTAFSATEEATYRQALDHIETLINVTFVEYDSNQHGSEPDINVGKVNMDRNTGGVGGYSYSATSNGDLVRLDGFTVFNNTLDLSNRLSLILHEIGHALTNKHPFSGPNVLPNEYDSNKYTLMSYDVNPDNGLDSDAMQLFDILALQDRWGVNADTNQGDTVYTGKRSTTVDSIWDTGGTDTFDASAKSSAVVLDLNEGAFSSFDSVDDVSIAYGVTIENAEGGSNNDTITGNAQANALYGNNGNDVLSGGTGRDSLWGQGNADKIFGEGGNDILRGGKGRDVLKGGNGRDTLQGDVGNDRLTGGLKADTFVFNSGHGRDVILDFADDEDILRLKLEGISTLSQLEAASTQTGNDLKLDLQGSDQITLKSITWAELSDDIQLL